MRKIIFALACGALLLPDYGFTLGMGEIEVSTALNQELKAEIELLSALPEDVETLIVKLASREEFVRAGIDRPYLLNSLRFSAELRNGAPVIKVTSDKPIREPFLNFLVEIDWPKGHMMREYTILLDPPVFMQQQAPVQQEQLRPAAMESSRPNATGAVTEPQSSTGFRPSMAAGASASAAVAVPVPAPSAQATQAQPAPSYTRQAQAVTSYTRTYRPPDGYRIQKGDTLWSLADSMRPDQSVSIKLMMIAMLRRNPEAFINENVNGLKRGYILRIPDRDEIVAINQAEAVALVREQNALWREYQQAVAGSEPASAMDRVAEDGQGVSIDEGDDARLEIVAAGSGVSASGAKDPTQMSSSELRAELGIARESLETERVEKEELLQRVDSLEGQVDRMKSLLTLEDSDLAEMQQAATPVEAEVMPDVDASEEAILEELADVVIDETAMEEGTVVEDITATEEALEEVAIEEGDEQQVFVDEEQVEVVEEAVEMPAVPAEEFAVEPSTDPAFMQQQKQGPISALLNNPVLLIATGGGLLLVLLLIALIIKRRKSGGEDEPLVASNLEDIADQIESSDVVIAEVEDQQIEQEMAEVEAEVESAGEELEIESAAVEPPVEDAVVSSPGQEPEEQEPRDDIIAEADVYLAYGIYQQAEELLQNALKDNPDKDSYRVKLAETYLSAKNSDALIELATEMNQRREGENTPAWQKVVAIGMQLVPDHGLFAGASVGDLSMDDLASSSPEPEHSEIGSDEDQEAIAPDLDLAFDESEAGIVEETAEKSFEPAESVEFDLSETGVETIAETEEGLEFGLEETQAFEADQTGEDFSLDINAAELGIEEETEAEDAGITLDGVDDASLEFDTDEAKVAAEPTSFADSMDDDLDLSDLDDIDEVSTKLDLAKAYLDMGDADGTRSILDEVMSEGNDEQKKEADDLLQQLG